MKNEVKVGLAVLLSAIALFVGVRYLSGQPLFRGDYSVIAVFEDARSLSRGSIVRMNGVAIGSVRDVRLSQDAQNVFVELGIDRGVTVPRGARIGTSGLSALGDVSVEITPPKGVDAGRPLANGDTVVAPATVDIFEMLAGESTGLTARADTAITRALSVFTTLDERLQNSGDDLSAVLAQLRFLTTVASQTIIEERDRISETLLTLQRAAQGAEQFSNDLSVLSEDLQGATGAFRSFADESSDSLQVTVAEVNQSLRTLDQSLTTLDALAVNVDSTLSLAQSPEGTLGLMLNDPTLYHNANAAAASLETLLQDLQNNPNRYLREVKLVDIF